MKKLFIILSMMLPMALWAQEAERVDFTAEQVEGGIHLTAHVHDGYDLHITEINGEEVAWPGDPLFTDGYTGTWDTVLEVEALALRYQSCDDMTCTQGQWEYGDTEAEAETVSADTVLTSAIETAIPETEETEDSESSSSLWWIFLMGLAGGLLAILTPCVWPIIPMTVSFFIKRSGAERGTTNAHAIRDAIAYGLSIIIIYVGLGLLVTLLFGASALNALSTNAVVNVIFFLVLVVFAASFFGAFEITLPSSWSTALSNKSGSTTGLLSILLMAFTLVIVSFSCTGPIIGTLLVEAAGKSLMAPAVGMLGFAIALALPFSLFAMFPSVLKKLPRSGGWMNTFKVTLAFLELALSLKFLSVADLAYGWHILDREVFVSLWIVIFALLGLYLLGIISFPHDDDDRHKTSVTRFFLAVVSLSFAMYMVPGLWGAPLRAISAFAPPMSTQDWSLKMQSGSTQSIVHSCDQVTFTDYDEGMAYAKTHNMPVFLDFNGYGCVNCRKMEAAVLEKPEVAEHMHKYVLISLIVDDKTPLDAPQQVEENGKTVTLKTVGDKWSYMQRSEYGANAQPYYIQLSAEGERLTEDSYSYDEDIDKFLQWLKY